MIKSKFEEVVQKTLRKRQNIVYIIIHHQSVINSFIKPRVKLNSEVGENPIPVLEYAPGFPTYVARNWKVPFGQRGGQ